MSELTLLLLRFGFLLLLWFFVLAVVFALRSDVFGVRVRKLPESSAPRAPREAKPPKPKAAPAASASGLATATTVTRIVITSGPKAGLELPLGTDTLTIGRSGDSGLVIRDDYTSSHHARLFLDEGQWTLQDLDSTNGTFHDGERVTSRVPVRMGAPIKVGATTFELRK